MVTVKRVARLHNDKDYQIYRYVLQAGATKLVKSHLRECRIMVVQRSPKPFA